MKVTFKEIILECEVCGKNRLNNLSMKHKIFLIPVKARIANTHVDLIGPLPETHRGHKYIFIFVGRLTKWVKVFPLKDKTAQTTAKIFFDKIVCRFGRPNSINWGQGHQFEDTLFNHLCEILRIKKSRKSSYYPKGNGMAERYIWSLKEKLRNLIDHHGKESNELNTSL